MSRKRDKLMVDDAVWLDALSREKVIRPLAILPRLSPLHVGAACRELKISRSRFYVLLSRYRVSPVTSSLLADSSGPPKGKTLLSPEIEEIIQTGVVARITRRLILGFGFQSPDRGFDDAA
ncbi:hypothetical protein [Rhizobium sp. 2TAF27]|uniref:hypothetical protein n=1 Tax=Rhizobium sp. 2TAF27 TaxID=3233013 RepID=UPI003F960A89